MKRLDRNGKLRTAGLLFSLILIFSSCSTLQQMAQMQKPKVNVSHVRMTGLSLDGVDLAFDLDIDNPNPLAVQLAGFDYDFKLSGSSFVRGDQQQPVSIPSQGSGRVEIPVSLTFNEIYQTYQSLKNQDSAGYSIHAGLTFDIPVLGPMRIPVETSGKLPLIKLPKLAIKGVTIKKLGFTSADLELNLAVDNPNAFSFLLKKLDYDFEVNGLSWAKGKTSKEMTVSKKKENSITIPVSLNLLQMGQTVMQMLSGDSNLNYGLKGGLDLSSSVPMIGQVSLPLDLSGQVPLTR